MSHQFPKFPLDIIAGLVLGFAVIAVAYLLTIGWVGDRFRLWWSARSWSAARCQVLRPMMHEEGILYGYEFRSGRHQATRIDIDENATLYDKLRATGAGAELDCWVNPQDPAQALLDKSYDGWWYLPGAWLLGAFLTFSSAQGLGRLWRWLVFKPDPPLTWAEWLRSLYRGHAWGPSLIGLCCLVPGLLALKFMTFDPWWSWRQAQQWEETPCTMAEGKIRWHSGGRYSRSWQGMDVAFEYYRGGKRYVSSTYSPWHLGRTDWTIPIPREVKDGKIIELTKELVLGSRHRCYVSPTNPENAFMYRGEWGGAYAVAAIGPGLCLLGLIAIAARPRYET